MQHLRALDLKMDVISEDLAAKGELSRNLSAQCENCFRSHPGSSHIFPCSIFGWDDAQTPTKTASVDPLVFFCFSIKGHWLVAPAQAGSTHSNPENHSTISKKSNFRQYGVVKSAEGRCNSAKVRRKKIRPCQMLDKSRNAVFFEWFVCRVSRKVGSLKRRVRSQVVRGEIKNCTPLWREAHFEVKMHKTPHSRSTFWSSDVEKLHAAVARSTFVRENAQNTTFSERNNQSLLYVSYSWNFRHRLVRYYWYVYQSSARSANL